MGYTTKGPAVGSRASIVVTPESTYGRLVNNIGVGTNGFAIPFTGESIKSSRNELTSATLDPSRGVVDVRIGSADVSGDINFEFRPEGLNKLIKAAMADGAADGGNYVVVPNARGDIGLQVAAYQATGGTRLFVNAERDIVEEWFDLYYDGSTYEVDTNASGAFTSASGYVVSQLRDFVHIERDDSGNLVARSDHWYALDAVYAYDSNSDGTADGSVWKLYGSKGDSIYKHILHVDSPKYDVAAGDLTSDGFVRNYDGLNTLTNDAYKRAWIFPVDASLFSDSYLHYIELGDDIPVGMNVDILRDIALFVYTGMRINQWTMNFNAGEFVNGTFSMIGKEEYIGGVLSTTVGNIEQSGGGNTLADLAFVDVDDVRIFNPTPTGTVWFDANVISSATNMSNYSEDTVGYMGVGRETHILYVAVRPEMLQGSIGADIIEFVENADEALENEISGRIYIAYDADATIDDYHKINKGIDNVLSGYVDGQPHDETNASQPMDMNPDNSWPDNMPYASADVRVPDYMILGSDYYGWFAGQAVWPMVHRALEATASGVYRYKDHIDDIPDFVPYTFFESKVLVSSGLTNDGVMYDDTSAVQTGLLYGQEQGVEYIDVMNATFTVDNGIYTDKYELGSKFRKKAPVQQRNVTGTLTLEFDDMTQYRKFFDETRFSIMLRVVSEHATQGQIGNCTGECPYSAVFYFDKCQYTGDTPTADGPDMITVDMPFRAMISRGSSTQKKFTELAVWLTTSESNIAF